MSLSTKTIVILDHSSNMSRKVQSAINFDQLVVKKNKAQAESPNRSPIKVSQTLWTCATQSVSEYCRIVWDIFGTERNVVFIINQNGKPRSLNTWQEQGMDHFMSKFSTIGPPAAQPTGQQHQDISFSSQIEALKMAVNKLIEPHPKDENKTSTRGRIIFLGCMINDFIESNNTTQNSLNSQKWRKEISSIIKHVNDKATARPNVLQINEIEILLIDLKDSKVINTESRIIADEKNFKLELCHVEAGQTEQNEFQLSTKLTDLAMHHHRLMRTTISGIPMKEEQSTTANKESHNYDVPLLHPQLGNSTETLILKWNTPKIDLSQLRSCSSAVRISPLEVNSRHSDCLTKFLTNGRCVLLEGAGKEITHMLACHGGDIYLHKIQAPQNTVTEPPAIAEGAGGKRSDYRINQFRELIKTYTLFPSSLPDDNKIADNFSQLERETRIWPLVNSDSALYSLPGTSYGLILNLTVQASLSDENKQQILSILKDLMEKERNGDPLPWSTGGRGGKPPRKTDQYKKLWQEVAELLEAHSNNSPNHRMVYEEFLNSRGKSPQAAPFKRRVEPNEPADGPVTKARTFPEQTAAISLFDLFSNRERQVPDKRFYGQQTERTKVQLYPKMGGEADQSEGMRTDGSDVLENKKHLDAQNQALVNSNAPNLPPPARKPQFESQKSATLADPRVPRDPRDPRQRDPRLEQRQSEPRFDAQPERLDRQRSHMHTDQRPRGNNKWK